MEHLLAASEQKGCSTHKQSTSPVWVGLKAFKNRILHMSLQDRNRKLAYSPSRSRWFSCTILWSALIPRGADAVAVVITSAPVRRYKYCRM